MLVSGRWYGEKATVPTCACMVGGWFWYYHHTWTRGEGPLFFYVVKSGEAVGVLHP